MNLNRRRFLARATGTAATLTLPLPALARAKGKGKVRVGMISDIHQDVMHDGLKRLGSSGPIREA